MEQQVTIGTFDHYCTQPGDCGERIGSPEGGTFIVRKYSIEKDGKRLSGRVFKTRSEAIERAVECGFTVIGE